MKRLSVVELRNSLADVLNRAEYRGERILIHRRGKDAAAIIPAGDLELLERLIEEAEDRVDSARAEAALAESADRIPYAEVRRRRLFRCKVRGPGFSWPLARLPSEVILWGGIRINSSAPAGQAPWPA